MSFVFLFPGQGSQSVGMGKYLVDIPVCKETFEQADQALGWSVTSLMWEGPIDTLTKTQNAQPAILTVAVAIGRHLMEKGIKPDIMAGHSLGEYACLVLGGAMRFEDALNAVHQRGKFMQEAVPIGTGTMAAILGLDDEKVEAACKQITADGDLVEAVNYNCPGQLVISGSIQGVEKACEKLKEEGAKRCIPLSVSAPFHSSMLAPASRNMTTALEGYEVCDPQIPYIANVDVELIAKADQIKERLVSQIDHPVRWTQTLQKLAQMHPEATFVEVGAAKVVTGHVKKVSRDLKTHTTESLDNIDQLLS